MSTTRMKRPAAVIAVAASMALVAGCSAGSAPATSSSADGNAEVTITVGGLPPTEQPEQRAAYETSIEEFEAENDNITIEAEETTWKADTFQALLAGGTMPTTMGVPFTEIGALIERKQVLPIGSYLNDSEVLANMNPTVMEPVTDDAGEVWGIPVNAYTMGLLYNRALFDKAGLDPDKPPTTWDEVRNAAKQIDEKTDAQGFQAISVENAGGWVLSATTYGFGGTLQSEDGATATINNPGTTAALELYRAMRWEDNTMGQNALVSSPDALAAFASGQVGMYVMAPNQDNYVGAITNNCMSPDDLGGAPLPQADDGIGTLGGGFLRVVNPTASPEEAAAALKWIEFSNFRKFQSEEIAVEEATNAAKAGVPVGAPGLPVVNAELNEEYLGWIEGQIDVPRENFEAYLSTVEEVPLVPEPKSKAQETYGLLDSVVQAVLTREDADIPALLDDAQKKAQAALDAG